MAFAELGSAMPEKLPGNLACNELGNRFEGVQSKRMIQLQPQGSAPFGPSHTRLLRFNITSSSGDYLIPDSLRLQANLNVEAGDVFKSLLPMGAMWSRMRIICEGVVIQDLMHADRKFSYLCEQMSQEQYKYLSNESFASSPRNDRRREAGSG